MQNACCIKCFFNGITNYFDIQFESFISVCSSYQKAFHPHFLFSQTKRSFPVKPCLIFMATTISGIHLFPQMATLSSLPLFLSILPLSSSSLSVLIEKGPPDPLLRWGNHNWRGSQFLPLCANGAALRGSPEAFDGIRRTHSYNHTKTHSPTSCMASVGGKMWAATVAR